jgi:hypothetical protein
MIYLTCNPVIGDGRQAANFRASTSSDRVRKLQADGLRLKKEIESERSKRLAIEKQLDSMKPTEAQLMAKLWAQVSGVKL